MPLQLIITILGALVPTLVVQAEKLFGDGNGPKKRQWVLDGVHAILSAVAGRLPQWATPAAQTIEPLVDTAINEALDKLGV